MCYQYGEISNVYKILVEETFKGKAHLDFVGFLFDLLF
jgi:hypothetical protein